MSLSMSSLGISVATFIDKNCYIAENIPLNHTESSIFPMIASIE